MANIDCPTFNICGWRDLYADCTPRDFNAIRAPKKLLMGPWKHEFPDKAREAPCAGLWEMERWFDRWLKGTRNGIDDEPAVAIYVQGAGVWRTETEWPPRRCTPQDFYLTRNGELSATAPTASTTSTDYAYDATVGLQSLVWDPWTTALDPALPRDQSGDDARSLCFTGEQLREPLELAGAASAFLEVTANALPLNLVVKLAEVAPNGRSTLIATGWLDLARHAKPGRRVQVEVPLRATTYRLAAGNRLRVAVACADFPRLWPTPKPATLSLFHDASRIRLAICPPPPGESPRPIWGKLQADQLASANDLGGSQAWGVHTDLITETATLESSRIERIRLDPLTAIRTDHFYSASVSNSRPDLATMQSTTTFAVERPTGRSQLVARTVTTAHAVSADVEITVDGQPFWKRAWRHREGE